jgi:ketosteroid isomerase-like protein
MMDSASSVEVVLAVFAAVEQRDDAAFARVCQPDAEFHWPPSLPYGRAAGGLDSDGGAAWAAAWDPLQPTDAQRRLDPRVVAATRHEVVVLWRQRGLTPAGDTIDSEVLGLYHVRDGKLARGQMFYFDPASVLAFLKKAAQAASGKAMPPADPPASTRTA